MSSSIVPTHTTPKPEGRVVIAFVLFQIVCQFALLIEALGFLRVGFRSLSFVASLVLLVCLPGRGLSHPAAPWAFAVMGVLALELLHPTGNSALAGLAQCVMYVAILAPVLWVTRLPNSVRVLVRVMWVLWAFHTAGSAVGVLQVYFPGQYQPSLSAMIKAQGDMYLRDLHITLSDGSQTFRPMGLTDAPGGAASSGMYAALFSLGIFLTARSWLMRGGAVASMLLGLFCIYLSQVRSVLVMTGVCVMVFAVMLGRRGDFGRLTSIAILAPLITFISFIWAVAVAGEAVTSRLDTLVEKRADEVYYSHRGVFLEETIDYYLPKYPLGAGLGRWGMMFMYFGDRSNVDSPPIWVEIQLTGWLLDGGVPLIICYTAALLTACLVAYLISIRAGAGNLGLWAAVICAYNIGALALTFNYPLFISQGGLEFWFLNALLFSAARNTRPVTGPNSEEGEEVVPEVAVSLLLPNNVASAS